MLGFNEITCETGLNPNSDTYTATSSTKNTLKQYEVRLWIFVVYTILQIACIEREWPPFMQWHWIWLTPSHIEYIALTTAVPFNTGHPSAGHDNWRLRYRFFPHYKVPLTFRYSWKRLRKRRSKNLIKFPQVYIAFVLQYVHCFEKKNTYWLNESWETRLPKRLKCTIRLLLGMTKRRKCYTIQHCESNTDIAISRPATTTQVPRRVYWSIQIKHANNDPLCVLCIFLTLSKKSF